MTIVVFINIVTQSLGGEGKGEGGLFGYWVIGIYFGLGLPATGREFGAWDLM
jgi:hypothetical protein